MTSNDANLFDDRPQWTRDQPKPHKHEGWQCPACVVWLMACEAEELLHSAFSPAFARDTKAMKEHVKRLGWEAVRWRWVAFLEASRRDTWLAQHRTIAYFAANINATWGREAAPDGPGNGRYDSI